MIEYKGQLNMGNEALNSGKTITANEVLLTCDEKALAREIHHQNSLIPEDVAASVLGYFGKAAAQLMAMGFAVQLKNGQDVLMRIYPDVHLKGGNINLARAKALDPTVTELTEENAGALIDKAGVTVRVRAICQQKFTDLLDVEGYQLKRTGIEVVPFVAKKGSEDEGEDTDNTQTGGTTDNPGTNTGGGLEG